MLGKVRFYNQEKGYGYIKANSGQDVYVSDQDLVDSTHQMAVGQIVEFDIVDSFRGPRAKRVVKKQK